MVLRLLIPIAANTLFVLDKLLWVETKQTFANIAVYFLHSIELYMRKVET